MQANRPGAGGSAADDSSRPISPKATLNRPVLITDAPKNLDDDWDRRRKRYAIMMLMRAVCVLGAAMTYTFSGWIAAGFVVGGLVLPWTAVIMANDRPPKEGVRFRRFFGGGDTNRAHRLRHGTNRQIESAPQSKFDPSNPSDGGVHPVVDP